MERLWKAALGVGGLAAVAFFVFYQLYDKLIGFIGPQALKLTPDAVDRLLHLVAILVFAAFACGIVAWLLWLLINKRSRAAVEDLSAYWDDVSYIDCRNLIGPDVDKAATALQSTASYWKHKLINKDQIFGRFGMEFIELFEQMDRCNRAVPGYEGMKKRCRDFLTAEVRSVYKQMKGR